MFNVCRVRNSCFPPHRRDLTVDFWMDLAHIDSHSHTLNKESSKIYCLNDYILNINYIKFANAL